MWEGDLRVLPQRIGAWPLLVCLLAGRWPPAQALPWQDAAPAG
jgi:hypothetical protein